MKIPDIRRRLIVIADIMELGLLPISIQRDKALAKEIRALAEATKRRPPVKKAKVKSQPLTPALIKAIQKEYAAHPDLSNQELANIFDVNPGRITRALAGPKT